MNPDESKELRQFYQSFLQLQRIFDITPNNQINVRGISIQPLIHEMNRLADRFPNIAAFPKTSIVLSQEYSLAAIRSQIAITLSRLQIAVEQIKDTTVTEERNFTFIKDANLRAIIERDFTDIQKSYISGCWKSVIILCGGAIEAILTDLLLSHENSAKACKLAPTKSDIMSWDLSDLINVSVALNLVSQGVEKLSNPIREYRNLVHPGNEVRKKIKFGSEEAKIAIEVLKIVHRDLS